MERKKPVCGSFYRHFKGNIYQVKSLAKHSETGEWMVVYQAMYAPFGVWVRPLNLFMGEVDHEKYPDVKQQWRFEEVNMETQKDMPAKAEAYDVQIQDSAEPEIPSASDVSDEKMLQAILSGNIERYLGRKVADEEIATRGFMAILDADSFHEKYKLFKELKPYLTEIMLSNLAVSMDIVLDEGSREAHYDAILHNLQTYDKYEGSRLR